MDKSQTEGTIAYDILFSAYSPKRKQDSQVIINVESQNQWNPGYSLTKRAAYYAARMLSRQKGTVFTGSDYGKLQKVYATVIMVCLGESERREKDILRLLGVLLSPEIRPGTKKKILEQEYGIPMTVEMEKEAETMCDYGRGLARKYAAKGRAEGLEQGLQQGLVEGRNKGRNAKASSRNATAISWACCGKRSLWRPSPVSRKYRWSRSGNWVN